MADEQTRADSLRFYHTGASADGNAQSDADASLGNYRSSTEVTVLDDKLARWDQVDLFRDEFFHGHNLNPMAVDEIQFSQGFSNEFFG